MKRIHSVLVLALSTISVAHAAPALSAKTSISNTTPGRSAHTVPTAPIQATGRTETIHVSSAAPTQVLGTSEDWKGPADTSNASFGAFTGLGVIDSSGGFALLGTASTKIVKDGWLADVNDAVSVEAYAGPIFTSGTSAFAYSLHLRWDFKKDANWTFYALGGLGGNIQSEALGNHFELFPRFAVGAFYDMGLPFLIRAEVSHELIAVGVNFRL